MNENSTLWKLFHSSWILVSFIIFLNGLGFLWIGFRANEKKWIYEGLIYESPLLLAIILPSSQTVTNIMAYLTIILWFISIIRSFVLRNKYLDKLRQRTYNSTYNSNQYQNSNTVNNNQYQNPTIINQENTIDFNPNLNEKDTTNIQSDNTPELIDINTASIDKIASIPVINSEHLNKIIELKNSGYQFKSYDDLASSLNLNQNEINQMKQFIRISNKTNRRLDL